MRLSLLFLVVCPLRWFGSFPLCHSIHMSVFVEHQTDPALGYQRHRPTTSLYIHSGSDPKSFARKKPYYLNRPESQPVASPLHYNISPLSIPKLNNSYFSSHHFNHFSKRRILTNLTTKPCPSLIVFGTASSALLVAMIWRRISVVTHAVMPRRRFCLFSGFRRRW
jgi:hypothetical protein